ncbi:MAG: multidrug transporter, partial [Parvibaculum sp.]
GSLAGGRLVRRLGIDATLRFGGFCAALGGLLMLTGAMTTPSALAIVLPVVIYGFSMGVTMPQAMAGALTPFPDIAGTASSLLGFLQSFAGALAGLYVGHGVEASALPMAGTIAAGGVLSLVIAMSGRRKV